MHRKNSYACFTCRKVFIRRTHWAIQPHPPRVTPIDKATCAECGGALYHMGIYFKAPKRTDIRQWRKIEKLRLNGVRFDFWGYPHMPRQSWDVDEYLDKRDEQRAQSKGEELLRKFKRHSGDD